MQFKSGTSVYQQIERAANLYQPSVYQLLSFFHALETEEEPLDNRFIPLTTITPRAPGETKIFAVGVLPPSSVVTGNILDRSASIQSKYGAVLESGDEIAADEIEEVQGNAVNDPLFVSTGPNNSTVAPRRRVAEKSAALVSGLHASIQPLAQKLVELAAQQGISLVVTQGHRSIEYQDKLYAQGRTEPGGIVTGVKGGQSWHNFGLAFDVAMVSPGPKPPTGSPSWPPQTDQWQVVGALGQSVGLVWGGTFSKLADYGHFEYHPGITKEQARNGARPDSPQEGSKPITDTALPANKWKADGAPNAQKTRKTSAQVAYKDLNQTNLGKEFMAAQQSTIKLMRAAIEQMAKSPPLRMLVNPQSFRVSAEKVVSSGNWGRSGPIIEHWGEQQDKIEGSGKIAAFYSMDSVDATGPGLTRTARQFSTSYQNFLSLFLLYKNNGGVWFPDPLLPSNTRTKNLAVVGSVYLYYDEILYIGSFDSLTATEAEGAPFSLEYSFSFTVRAWYLLDHLDDPRYTYGRPVNTALPTSTGVPPFTGGNNAQPSPDVAIPPLSNEDPLFGINEGDIGDNLEGI